MCTSGLPWHVLQASRTVRGGHLGRLEFQDILSTRVLLLSQHVARGEVREALEQGVQDVTECLLGQEVQAGGHFVFPKGPCTSILRYAPGPSMGPISLPLNTITMIFVGS